MLSDAMNEVDAVTDAWRTTWRDRGGERKERKG
jgi:hypothetical protein